MTTAVELVLQCFDENKKGEDALLGTLDLSGFDWSSAGLNSKEGIWFGECFSVAVCVDQNYVCQASVH